MGLRKLLGARKLLQVLLALPEQFECLPDQIHVGNWKVRLVAAAASASKQQQAEQLESAEHALEEEIVLRLSSKPGGMPVAVLLTNGKTQRRIKNVVAKM